MAVPTEQEKVGPAWGLLEAFGFCMGLGLVTLSFVVGGDERWVPLGMGLFLLTLSAFAVARPFPRRSARVGELWWVGLLPLGLGTWLSFAYVGWRTRSPGFLAAAACYLAAIVLAGVLNLSANDEGAGSDAAAALWFGTWIVGGLHGFLLRRSIRARFERLT